MTVFAAATFGAQLNTLAARFAAPEADKHNWSVRGREARSEQALGLIADVLGDKPFLAGDDLTLADICVVTAFGMWRGALNKPLSDRLTTYRDRIAARPAYQRASQKQKG